jgi:hypothetical protein
VSRGTGEKNDSLKSFFSYTTCYIDVGVDAAIDNDAVSIVAAVVTLIVVVPTSISPPTASYVVIENPVIDAVEIGFENPLILIFIVEPAATSDEKTLVTENIELENAQVGVPGKARVHEYWF